MAAVYTTQNGDMLDLICLRHYGLHEGTVEAVLEANYRLADQLPVLPDGLLIYLPDLPQQGAPERQKIRLWD